MENIYIYKCVIECIIKKITEPGNEFGQVKLLVMK